MAQRQQLHDLLVAIAGKAYFDPPEDAKLEYPCVLYKRNTIKTFFANNLPFLRKKSYQLTVMDRDADSDIPDKVGALPMCSFDRHYAVDQLHHDVFTIFF